VFWGPMFASRVPHAHVMGLGCATAPWLAVRRIGAPPTKLADNTRVTSDRPASVSIGVAPCHTREVSLSALSALFAAGDTSASVTVWLLIIGLVAVGVLAVLVAVWAWRGTRVDSPALAVLEEMSRRGVDDDDTAVETARWDRDREIDGDAATTST